MPTKKMIREIVLTYSKCLILCNLPFEVVGLVVMGLLLKVWEVEVSGSNFTIESA